MVEEHAGAPCLEVACACVGFRPSPINQMKVESALSARTQVVVSQSQPQALPLAVSSVVLAVEGVLLGRWTAGPEAVQCCEAPQELEQVVGRSLWKLRLWRGGWQTGRRPGGVRRARREEEEERATYRLYPSCWLV